MAVVFGGVTVVSGSVARGELAGFGTAPRGSLLFEASGSSGNGVAGSLMAVVL